MVAVVVVLVEVTWPQEFVVVVGLAVAVVGVVVPATYDPPENTQTESQEARTV